MLQFFPFEHFMLLLLLMQLNILAVDVKLVHEKAIILNGHHFKAGVVVAVAVAVAVDADHVGLVHTNSLQGHGKILK